MYESKSVGVSRFGVVRYKVRDERAEFLSGELTIALIGDLIQRDVPTTAAGIFALWPNTLKETCIKCEDPSCGGWDVQLDEITYERYRELPLRNSARSSGGLVISRPRSDSAPTLLLSYIKQIRVILFHSSEGPAMQHTEGIRRRPPKCNMFSLYPSFLSKVNGKLKGTLSLSCPEAARLVLLNPSLSLLESNLHSGEFRTDNIYSLAATWKSIASLSALSDHTIFADELIRDRSRPIWQNLLMVASFCKRLDEAMIGLKQVPVPALSTNTGWLLARDFDELESLPRDLKRQIELVIALSSGRSETRLRTKVPRRFLGFRRRDRIGPECRAG